MQGKVSMVVPCYNKEQYIGAMLRSVCGQVWDNIELILVNDGSTDGTRDIILEWLPKLEARGYEVVLIDQENGGCCAAVLAGLKRMTGDYFCLVDCDDEIMPEYVSRMAGWLDTHEDYEWAACSYQPFLTLDGQVSAQPPVKTGDRQDSEKLLERHILRRVITTVWIYMTRVSYLKECGLIENYCGERRATYEPLIIVPLAYGGGRLKFFDEPLYKYNRFASDMYYFDRYARVEKYYGDYLYLYEWAISRLKTEEAQKQRLTCIARLANKKDILYHLNDSDVVEQKVSDRSEYIDMIVYETTILIDELFSPSPNIAPSFFADNDYISIFSYLEDLIINGVKAKKMRNNARIVGYGVLGKRGQSIIPRLAGTSAMPVLMWDAAAKRGDEICGVSVTEPDFSSLSENDVVFVFPSSPEVLDFVCEQCKKAETLFVSNSAQCIIAYKFPRLADCEFLPGIV